MVQLGRSVVADAAHNLCARCWESARDSVASADIEPVLRFEDLQFKRAALVAELAECEAIAKNLRAEGRLQPGSRLKSSLHVRRMAVEDQLRVLRTEARAAALSSQPRSPEEREIHFKHLSHLLFQVCHAAAKLLDDDRASTRQELNGALESLEAFLPGWRNK